MLASSAFVCACAPKGEQEQEQEQVETFVSVKNVVLMIGDGMGKNHIRATADYYGEELYMESLAYADGEVTTRSLDSEVTDSAAAATALSCGVKTNNNQVGMLGEEKLTNMTEYMHSIGKRVGIIATEAVTGATPAGFSSHCSDRKLTVDILYSQLEVGADLLIGSSRSSLNVFSGAIASAGYVYMDKLRELVKFDFGQDKAFLAVDGFNAYGEDTQGYLTLDGAAATAFDALNYKNENGFFLMVEASHIDKYSHSNDLMGMLKQLKRFDLAIKAIVDRAKADGDTLVIVTADHETGDLQYSKGDDFANSLFHSASHTGQNVKYFIYGKEGLKVDATIDNTDICKIIRECASKPQSEENAA